MEENKMTPEERVKKFGPNRIENKKIIRACDCGHNRWKTIIKGKKWECRNCHKIRGV